MLSGPACVPDSGRSHPSGAAGPASAELTPPSLPSSPGIVAVRPSVASIPGTVAVEDRPITSPDSGDGFVGNAPKSLTGPDTGIDLSSVSPKTESGNAIAGHPQELADVMGRCAIVRKLALEVAGSERSCVVFPDFGQSHPVALRRSWKMRRSKLYARLASVSFASARAMPIVRMNSP